jgi:NitT/TauT family transport system permease protein
VKRIHYISHRGRRKHPTTITRRLFSALILPIVIVFVASFVATGIVFAPESYVSEGGTLLLALGASVLRLGVAYVLALVIGIPLGLLAESNQRLENVLLPIYDVLESLPVLAFFPIVILFFIRSGLVEGAALFIIFFTIVWTIAFSTIGGMKLIPQDVKSAGKVFGLSAYGRFRHILLPALFPPLLTASILSIADGWNLVIVAEALHAYVPSDSSAHDLFGIGSILVSASSSGNTHLLLAAMLLLVVFITIVNLLLWQPLLSRAERYKFE